jgi:hypothetical protein
MAANVCVSAVVPYRSRVLSHETKTLNEDKTFYQLVTAPLQKHFVVGSAVSLSLFSETQFIIPYFFLVRCQLLVNSSWRKIVQVFV